MKDAIFYMLALFVGVGTFGVFVAIWLTKSVYVYESNPVILILETAVSAAFLVLGIERVINKFKTTK